MSPFIQKLRHGAYLTRDDETVLARLAELVHRVERGDVLPEGDGPRSIILVLQGWACRYKQLENGKRQITSIFLPGDLCEPFGALPQVMDHSIGALTQAVLARVPLPALRSAARASEPIEDALWWDLLMADSAAREHMVSLGRRSAVERLGHFFCELQIRLEMVAMTDQSSYDFPLTQADLADLLGLSTVHVNRALQELRRNGFLSLRGRRMTIHDVHGLRELSMFDPTYLRSSGATRTLSAPFSDQDRR